MMKNGAEDDYQFDEFCEACWFVFRGR